MKKTWNRMFALTALLALAPAPALASDRKIDIGQREYLSNCVACHGVTGKGEGPVAPLLKSRVPDLSLMSRQNGGVFPFARVYDAIDGRVIQPAHGTRDMPIWGNAYKSSGAPEYDDYPYNAEFFVRSRILALIDYLNRMQAK